MRPVIVSAANTLLSAEMLEKLQLPSSCRVQRCAHLLFRELETSATMGREDSGLRNTSIRRCFNDVWYLIHVVLNPCMSSRAASE